MDKLKFKGGPIFLNSGGTGPDDYLLKPLKGGKWTRVVFRYGRNYDGNLGHADADKVAREKIFPVEHICVPDNARRWQRGRDRIPTLFAAEFVEKYG